MKRRLRFIAATIILTVFLSACSSQPQITQIPGLEMTLAVRTLVAQQGISYFASATPSPEPVMLAVFNEPQNSSFVEAQFTPDPGPTPVPSLTPFGLGIESYEYAEICKNKAQFVNDISYPDLTQVKAGQRFTKVWQMLNSGTCTWTPEYSIVFTYGDRMGGVSPKPLGIQVLPGEMVEISVDLVAPTNSNLYQGNWMFSDEDGNLFGTGSGPNDYFWVAVVVGGRGGFGSLSSIFGGCGGGG